MTVKQNLEFIQEAVKYAEYSAYKIYVDDELNNEYEFRVNKFTESFYEIPLGFSTICNVIMHSTELDDLIKLTKFRNMLFKKTIASRYLQSINYLSFEDLFCYLLLMCVCRKFPDMLKLKTFMNYITEDDVNEFFEFNFRKIDRVNSHDETC